MSRVAREWDHIADVFHACGELDKALKAGTEACVGY